MDIASLVLQFGSTAAFLLLSAVGLAVIFGMMGVVNLAHGELIMLGAYGTCLSYSHGLPLAAAMICGVGLATLAGMILEATIIRRLYGRPAESLVVTWAVGLIVSQGTLIILGPSLPSIPTPFGSFVLGTKSFSAYRIVLIAASVLSLLAVHFLLKRTRFGLHARATMQNPEIARAIGIDNAKIYRWTFALGSALAGVTGALYAPTMSIVPTMGGSFIVQAFVTVVTGGGNLLYGTLPAASGLGFIQTALTAAFGNLLGVLGLLAAVIVSAGVLPNGLAYYLSGKRVS